MGNQLPDFLIIGAIKAGTTALYEYLSEHPDIAMAREKELHFFSNPERLKKGLKWYKRQFHDSAGRKRVLRGEASSDYLQTLYVPQMISLVMPDVKLIVLLRNPIDRAYSNYQMVARYRDLQPFSFWDIRQGDGSLMSFEEAVEQELNGQSSLIFLKASRYLEQLEEWFSYFKREQFLIISSEDMYEDPQREYDKVLEFLEVPAHKLLDRSHRFKLRDQYPQMNTDTRKKLNDLFSEHNEKLYRLLDKNFEWE